MLFYAFWIMIAIAVATFVLFLPHTFLWGWRDFIHGHVKKEDARRIERFRVAQRLFHLFLMLSFLTQAATGFSRMYIETAWGRALASFFGGYQLALTLHKWVGIFMVFLFSVHLLKVLNEFDWR